MVCLTSNNESVCNTECVDCSSERFRRALEGNSKKDLAEAHLVRGPYRIIDKDEENSDKVPNDDDSHDEGVLILARFFLFVVSESEHLPFDA